MHPSKRSINPPLKPTESTSTYKPRKPYKTILYEVFKDNLMSFFEEWESKDSSKPLPNFVRKELSSFTDCGILQKGFTRIYCKTCKVDTLLPFSCKRRGFCPSCMGRRMTDTAAHLTDRIFPHTPVRQWVLSLPFRIRLLIAFDSKLCSEVLNIFIKIISAHYKKKAKEYGIKGAKTGSITVIQRFGSTLNLNVHFHSLFVDGVFFHDSPKGLSFKRIRAPSDSEVEILAAKLNRKIIAHLQKRGFFETETSEISEDARLQLELSPTLAATQSASIKRQVYFGTRKGQSVMRLGDIKETEFSFITGKRSAMSQGFSLHANTSISAKNRAKLEMMCRYLMRPPLSESKLTKISERHLAFELKKPFRDGTTHMVFTPVELIEKLAALIPRTYSNQIRYHGFFAPYSNLRSQVVLFKPGKRAKKWAASIRARRLNWHDLLKRTYAVDVLICKKCENPLKIISVIKDKETIEAILKSIGIKTAAPVLSASRGPPKPLHTFDEYSDDSYEENWNQEQF
jgi:hypothetical protein